jgi:hypothetical protein
MFLFYWKKVLIKISIQTLFPKYISLERVPLWNSWSRLYCNNVLCLQYCVNVSAYEREVRAQNESSNSQRRH